MQKQSLVVVCPALQTFMSHEKVTRPYISKLISRVEPLHESDARPTWMSYHKSSGLCPGATFTLIPLKKPLTGMALFHYEVTRREVDSHSTAAPRYRAPILRPSLGKLPPSRYLTPILPQENKTCLAHARGRHHGASWW